MNRITASAPVPAESPKNVKVLRAGADFEAVLLNAVFGGLQSAFTHLPGAHESGFSKNTYNGIAMQALASGVARGGGIGLGALVTRWLQKRHATEGASH
jgi:Rod binding domain-containing protein